MALPNDMRKTEVPVTIVLLDGTAVDCNIFVEDGQRLLELMNDQRNFIPYTNSEGEITIIQKSIIARITPIEENIIKISPAPGAADN